MTYFAKLAGYHYKNSFLLIFMQDSDDNTCTDAGKIPAYWTEQAKRSLILYLSRYNREKQKPSLPP